MAAALEGNRGGSPACSPNAARAAPSQPERLWVWACAPAIPHRLRLAAGEASCWIMHILSRGGSVPGSGTPPPLVPVRDGSSAPTPPPAPGSPPRALSSLATFLEDALAPPPEPVRAAARSHLLRGCQPDTAPLLRRCSASSLLDAGGHPLCVSRLGTLAPRADSSQGSSRLCRPVPSSPDVPSRSARLASCAQRSASLTQLPAVSSLLYSAFPSGRTQSTPFSLTF